MRLFDRADGVKGHFCISRYNSDGNFIEFYNRGMWCSAGELFIGKDIAEKKLKELGKKK